MDEVVKYYVWHNDERICDDGFYNFEDAFKYAQDYDGNEIEKTVWHSEEVYQNREPADEFETVWRRE